MSATIEHKRIVQRILDRTASGQQTEAIHQAPLANDQHSHRLSVSHVKYWRSKLKHRKYRDRATGAIVEVPEWQVRLCHAGHEAWFNLGDANIDVAAEKARDIYQMLANDGWEATLAKFKPKAETKAEIILPEFADLYRELLQTVEYPPSKPTAERYLKSLSFIGRRVDVDKVQELTADKVKEFVADYLAEGRKEARPESSIKTTINFHIRNASALFSRQMLAAYQSKGLILANPFAGQKLRRVEIKGYSPMKKELLDKIWLNAAKLRDGDPAVPKREVIRTGGKKVKKPPGQKSKRWQQPDFHEPHPDAYVLLLLELGLGLRRNEADQAQWDWFFDNDGRHYIEIKETPYFLPKSKERRVIPVEPVLYDAIQATRNHAGAWIVPGRLPKRYAQCHEPKNIVYRCDMAQRALAVWLRQRGIQDNKPCHTLRKEFGSYVATAFGLFHAQKMLGHLSPDVTSTYYAGLTQLPELKHAKVTS